MDKKRVQSSTFLSQGFICPVSQIKKKERIFKKGLKNSKFSPSASTTIEENSYIQKRIPVM